LSVHRRLIVEHGNCRRTPPRKDDEDEDYDALAYHN
jgi:hypothetical protein